MHDDKLLTIAEVGDILNMHGTSVRNMIKRGTINALQIGGRGGTIRIRHSEVQRVLVAAAIK